MACSKSAHFLILFCLIFKDPVEGLKSKYEKKVSTGYRINTLATQYIKNYKNKTKLEDIYLL